MYKILATWEPFGINFYQKYHAQASAPPGYLSRSQESPIKKTRYGSPPQKRFNLHIETSEQVFSPIKPPKEVEGNPIYCRESQPGTVLFQQDARATISNLDHSITVDIYDKKLGEGKQTSAFEAEFYKDGKSVRAAAFYLYTEPRRVYGQDAQFGHLMTFKLESSFYVSIYERGLDFEKAIAQVGLLPHSNLGKLLFFLQYLDVGLDTVMLLNQAKRYDQEGLRPICHQDIKLSNFIIFGKKKATIIDARNAPFQGQVSYFPHTQNYRSPSQESTKALVEHDAFAVARCAAKLIEKLALKETDYQHIEEIEGLRTFSQTAQSLDAVKAVLIRCQQALAAYTQESRQIEELFLKNSQLA